MHVVHSVTPDIALYPINPYDFPSIVYTTKSGEYTNQLLEFLLLFDYIIPSVELIMWDDKYHLKIWIL